MENDVAEYGILVTVRSAKDTYLFLDGTDRARYMAIFIKMLGRNAIGDARPLIAGLNSDTAQILFQNGYEEPLRLLVRMMHASYASYRKAKNCPVQLARSAFDLIDGKKEVAGAVKSIRDKSDFICTIFDREGEHCPPPGTLAERIKTIPGKISGTLLLELAAAYQRASFDELLRDATPGQLRELIQTFRNQYELSFREIGRLLNCSCTTVHRILNKPI